jgi:hypothetical protein
VKALRDKARSTGADAEQLKRLRDVHDALKKRHKVHTHNVMVSSTRVLNPRFLS